MSKPKYSASSLASDVRTLVTKACEFITRKYLEMKCILQWQKTPKQTNRNPKPHKIAIINMLTCKHACLHVSIRKHTLTYVKHTCKHTCLHVNIRVQSKNFNREIENIEITKREMVELENVINKLKN